MNFTIEQHEQHLKNMRANYARELAHVKSEQQRVMRLECDCLRLETQITEAKRQGKTTFDDSRFMRKQSSR